MFLDINDKIWDGQEEEEGSEEERGLRTNSQKVERAAAEWESDKPRPPPGRKGIGKEHDWVISRWKGQLRVKINLSEGSREMLPLQLEVCRLLVGNCCQTRASTLHWLWHIPERPKVLLHSYHHCFCYSCSLLRGKQDFALHLSSETTTRQSAMITSFWLVYKQGDRHSQTNPSSQNVSCN